MNYRPLYMPSFGSKYRNKTLPSTEHASDWIDAVVTWAGGRSSKAREIAHQLEMRPHPPDSVWGNDPERLKIAHLVCRLAQEYFWWPNDHFIPEDPASVAFYEHVDGMDFTGLVIGLEDELSTSFIDEEALAWLDMSLGEVVDWLLGRVSANHSE